MLYLAEFYLPASVSLGGVVARARTAARRAAGEVALVQVVFLPSDETCLALYRAPSAAEVSAAGRAAGLEFDRVTPATAVPGPE
jgi:hypothetical protein